MKTQLKTLSLSVALLLAAACAKLDRIDATPKTLMFSAASQTQAVAAKGIDQNGKEMENVQFTFTSSNPAVATVDAAGMVKAVKSGSATIEVASGEKKESVSIDVKIPAKIVLDPSPITLQGVGTTAALTAKVVDDAERPIENAAVTFAVADPAIATLNEKTLTSVAIGATKVKATFGALSAEGDLTVALPPFETIAVEPAMVNVKAGEKAFLTTTVKDAAGNAVPGVAVAFATSDDKVATVENGQITGVGAGTATVTLTAGEKKAEVKVTVKK